MDIRNEDIREMRIEVPEGHKHLRTTLSLQDGSELVLQEATVANLVRAYVTVKTHPQKSSILLKGTALSDKKPGFADWQLIEE